MRPLAFTRTFYQRFARIFNPLIATALILVVVRSFVADTYRIPSDSMQPTLVDGDHVIGLKLFYGIKIPFGGPYIRFSSPEKGDAVVIKRADGLFYIKRIIAISPDKVDFKKGDLYINDKKLKKIFGTETSKYRYINNDDAVYREFIDSKYYSVIYSGTKRPQDIQSPVKLGVGKLFVIGDNRTNSVDSRQWGPIDNKDVIARPIFVWFSKDPVTGKIRWDRIGSID